MHDLETAQSKLIKTAFGLPKFCRNTPLLHALCINKVRTQNITNQLNLINQIFCNNSKSRKLYAHLLNVEVNGRKNIKNTLIDQIKYNLKDEDFNLSSYIMNNQYRRNLNKQLKCIDCNEHGICDSVKTIMERDPSLNNESIQYLKLLLRSF